ncbi:hypothetical protein acsn021_10860 [Anaerocolumna cellulosilytica]|uniref:Uncharacterized protein n=1 Tax=Anaerocolumna cellulosilytica TaxID=433286 RepID=A0A6S6R0A4_9FIRM|nr:hypothetical protein [Anaerocolumna cellulosilytica]MBB5194573.1 VanZ family protein [Anaerocolumna cellulosilytica]BCJ93517.1 hypothetical protein acsn021_10860 [Anaerocolumna cellulosilytica]
MNSTQNKKRIIKSHSDILTVQQAINDLYNEYKKMGYDMIRKILNAFTYRLDDGSVAIVYWDKGNIYEKVVESKGGQ